MIEMTKGRKRAPYAADVKVRVRLRCGEEHVGKCSRWDWTWGIPGIGDTHLRDIVAYEKVEDQENV